MHNYFYHLSKLTILPTINILSRLTGQKLVLPFYHIVSNETNLIHIKHLYKVRNTREFERDLDFLLKHFKPIDYSTLTERLKNNELHQKNEFLLTFDDGLREFYDVVAPILLRKGIPAINFLNPSFIDNKDLFYRYKVSILLEHLRSGKNSDKKQNTLKNWFAQNDLAINEQYTDLKRITYENRHKLDHLAELLEVDFGAFLKEKQPYMSSTQIASLAQHGFTFGGHSMDHPHYSKLSQKEQIMQTRSSIESVTTQFKLDYKTFSFPFTDFGVSHNYFKTTFENKWVETSFGSAGLKKDTFANNLQRIPIEIGEFSAEQIIKGEYLYWVFKACIGKNKIRRQ